jgi:hypothetical protein
MLRDSENIIFTVERLNGVRQLRDRERQITPLGIRLSTNLLEVLRLRSHANRGA